MSVQNKPDYKIFAGGAKPGEVVTFPDILRGWGVTLDTTGGIPPMEFFNSFGKRLNEWLMYLTQRGTPEWDAAVDYPKDAMIQYAGVYYVSLKVTKGEQPNNSQASWKKLTEFLGVDGKLTKDQNGADIPNKPKFIENIGLGGAAKSNVTQATGTSKTDVMSQDAVTKLADTKFDKTGGTITTTSRAIDIVTRTAYSGYIQISDENGNAIHQIGKLGDGSILSIKNISENALLTITSGGIRFNSKLVALTDTLLGINQNWVNVKSQRNANTAYVNSTGKPIYVSIGKGDSEGEAGALLINGVQVGILTGSGPAMATSAIVPPGSSYKYTSSNFMFWSELS